MIPIPPPPSGRPLFWAMMLACLLAIGAAMSAQVAVRSARQLEMAALSQIVVQIAAPEEAGAAARATEIAKSVPGVAHAERMTPARAAALLRASGAPVPPGPLPDLGLIEVEVEPGADAAGAISEALRKGGIEAQVIQGSPGAARSQSQGTERAAYVIALVAIVFSVFAAWLIGAARGAASAETAAGLADLGATRGQVMGVVAGEAALSAFGSGALAALSVTAVILALRLHGPDPGLALALAHLKPIEYAPLAAAPALAWALAGLGARSAASSAYSRAALKP